MRCRVGTLLPDALQGSAERVVVSRAGLAHQAEHDLLALGLGHAATGAPAAPGTGRAGRLWAGGGGKAGLYAASTVEACSIPSRHGSVVSTLRPRMAAASHGRLLLGAATASATCYLLWRFYRRRQSGARPVASEQLQLHEEADTSLRRWAAVISTSTTRTLRLHPDRPCRYDGFVRPRSEIVFQFELPASSSARGVQVRALDASGDSLRLYWRAGEAARPADGVYDGCCTHPPLYFEWRAAAGQAAPPAQSAGCTLYVTLVNQQGPQAARCSITATPLAPGRGRAQPPAPADGAVAGTSPPASPPLSPPSVAARRLAKLSIVPQVPPG